MVLGLPQFLRRWNQIWRLMQHFYCTFMHLTVTLYNLYTYGNSLNKMKTKCNLEHLFWFYKIWLFYKIKYINFIKICSYFLNKIIKWKFVEACLLSLSIHNLNSGQLFIKIMELHYICIILYTFMFFYSNHSILVCVVL